LVCETTNTPWTLTPNSKYRAKRALSNSDVREHRQHPGRSRVWLEALTLDQAPSWEQDELKKSYTRLKRFQFRSAISNCHLVLDDIIDTPPARFFRKVRILDRAPPLISNAEKYFCERLRRNRIVDSIFGIFNSNSSSPAGPCRDDHGEVDGPPCSDSLRIIGSAYLGARSVTLRTEQATQRLSRFKAVFPEQSSRRSRGSRSMRPLVHQLSVRHTSRKSLLRCSVSIKCQSRENAKRFRLSSIQMSRDSSLKLRAARKSNAVFEFSAKSNS